MNEVSLINTIEPKKGQIWQGINSKVFLLILDNQTMAELGKGEVYKTTILKESSYRLICNSAEITITPIT